MNTPQDPTQQAVAGLAREVEALRRTVDELAGLPGRVEEVAELLARLSEHTAAVAGGSDEGGVPAAPSWIGMRGQAGDGPRLLLRAVARWTGRVFLTYPDAREALPECWLWHPDVIEELIWLMHAWQAAYDPDTDTYTHLAGDWHDRLRPGVVRRIAAAHSVCSLHSHRDPTRPDLTAPVASATETIAAWWTGAPNDPAPLPAEDHFGEVDERRRRRHDRTNERDYVGADGWDGGR